MCLNPVRSWTAAVVVALSMLVGPPATRVAHAGIMLGAGWTEDPTNGYEMNKDGQLDSVGSFQAQPLKQIVPNWNTLNPVTTLFTQGNSNDNNIFQYFKLRLELTNKTNQA